MIDLATLAGIVKAADQLAPFARLNVDELETSLKVRGNSGEVLRALNILQDHVHALKVSLVPFGKVTISSAPAQDHVWIWSGSRSKGIDYYRCERCRVSSTDGELETTCKAEDRDNLPK